MSKHFLFLILCVNLFADKTKDIENIGDILKLAIPAYAYGYSYYKGDFANGGGNN